MSGNFTPMADPLQHADDDTGYRVGWKYKYQFEKGHLDGPMTYGEARAKAKELGEKEPEKTFWPELMYN